MNTKTLALLALLTLVALPTNTFADDAVNGTAPVHHAATSAAVRHLNAEAQVQAFETRQLQFNPITGQPLR
ncbi:MAG TPA: hypothetical protein VGC39_02785 [Candidatus Methylacidiphilales bacterium]